MLWGCLVLAVLPFVALCVAAAHDGGRGGRGL